MEIRVTGVEATEPLRVHFVSSAGEGVAEWKVGDAYVGQLDWVEVECEGALRWTSDGYLTTAEVGRCHLRATVEAPSLHGFVTLRMEEGLLDVQMGDGERAPAVGAKIVLHNVGLSLWSMNL